MNDSIVFKNIFYRYPDGNLALDDVSLVIPSGHKVSIVGPNGAGKSTLLMHTNGLLKGDGSVIVEGLPVDEPNLHLIRRKVGFLFQDPNDQLFCPTVYDDIAFGPIHFGLSNDDMKVLVAANLERVGLRGYERRSAHHLSLGERRRISIASVLACEPSVFVFDEPTSNLDPKNRRELIDFIRYIPNTTLIATHDLDMALDVTTECVIMNKGKIVAAGPTKDILTNESLLKANDLELPLSVA